MMQVWILAAGDQARWGLLLPKQLVPIGDELLLQRTVRQVRARNTEPIIATINPQISGVAHALGCETFWPPVHHCTVATALSCLHQSEAARRQIVLLGDVVFTDETMATIVSCEDACRVFLRASLAGRVTGFYREIFGFSFVDHAYARVMDALVAALAHAENGGAGKLREFYCALCGIPFSADGNYVLDRQYIHWPINDYTDDIDSPEDYEAFVTCIVGPGLIDTRH